MTVVPIVVGALAASPGESLRATDQSSSELVRIGRDRRQRQQMKMIAAMIRLPPSAETTTAQIGARELSTAILHSERVRGLGDARKY